tara:strand:+ start:240 stop:509 length:270 start_codon:yes stop_codon:yes gene_type:complete
VDLKQAQPQRDVTSQHQSQQKELQKEQFRRKTLELVGVNRKIAQCWQHLATKVDVASQRNLGRALKLLVLKRTKLLQQLTELLASRHLQ